MHDESPALQKLLYGIHHLAPDEKCLSEVLKIGSIIFFRPSKLWKVKFFIVWCYISGEATGEIWHWSHMGGGGGWKG